MPTMRSGVRAAIAAIGAAAAAFAFAQAPQATRLVGKVEKISGSTLVVKTAAAEREVTLPADLPVFAIARGNVSDIKPNSFIGVGATPQPDGSQKAIRVTIFPESMRGLGEGHRPWDRPGTTMTNATVENSVQSVDGPVFMVRYKGGDKKIVIGPEATIITFLQGERSELKPGANVAITAVTKGAALEATRINVGRGDMVP
jgi:hypothetical protein